MVNPEIALHDDASFAQKLVVLFLVVIPLLGLVATFCLLWGNFLGWVDLGLFLTFYAATALGITVGFHRLFTHCSFETVAPIRFLLAVAGSMATQGPLLQWVAFHRQHHQHSDNDKDPHSPHHFGKGVRGVLLGFWHAHIGWMAEKNPPSLSRYVPDLEADPMIREVSRWFVLWVALGLVLPALIGGLLTMSWLGVLTGFLCGGLARVFAVHHVTWSVNSVCHLWGGRPFDSRDESRNNAIFGILAMGEGWHNNHHAFPTSARHGLRWWEFDISYILIRTLTLLGLAWKVRLPSPESLVAKRMPTG